MSKKTKWICNACDADISINADGACTVKLDSEYIPYCCVVAPTGAPDWVKVKKKEKPEDTKNPMAIDDKTLSRLFPDKLYEKKWYRAQQYAVHDDPSKIDRCGGCDLRGDICYKHIARNACGSHPGFPVVIWKLK